MSQDLFASFDSDSETFPIVGQNQPSAGCILHSIWEPTEVFDNVVAESERVLVGSQISDLASGGLHISTPCIEGYDLQASQNLFSQPEAQYGDCYDSQANDHVSQKEAISQTSFPTGENIRQKRITKAEACKLIKELETIGEAGEAILAQFIGGQFVDLNKTKDIDEFERVKKIVVARLYRLASKLKERKLRHHKDSLEATFMKDSEFDILQRSHYSFKNNSNVEESSTEDINANTEEHLDVDEKGDAEVENNNLAKLTQRKWKPLNELQDAHWRGDRSKEDFDQFLEASERQNVEPAMLAGYFMQRHYYHKQGRTGINRKIAQIGSDLFKGDYSVLIRPKLSLEASLHLVERYDFGRTQYINVSHFFGPYLHCIPYYLVSQYRRSITPEIHPYPVGVETNNAIGSYVQLEEALKMHLLRLIQYDGDFIANHATNFKISVHVGMDNAGDEKEYAQVSHLGVDTTHAENVSYCLTSIHEAAPIEVEEPIIDRAEELIEEEAMQLSDNEEFCGFVRWETPPLASENVQASHTGQIKDYCENDGIRVFRKYDLEIDEEPINGFETVGDYNNRKPSGDETSRAIKLRSFRIKYEEDTRQLENSFVEHELFNFYLNQGDNIEENYPEILPYNSMNPDTHSPPKPMNEDTHSPSQSLNKHPPPQSMDMDTHPPPLSMNLEAHPQSQSMNSDTNSSPFQLPKIKKPVGFQEIGKTVWTEKNKSSVRSIRPWGRFFERENDQTLRPLFQTVVEPQILNLTTQKPFDEEAFQSPEEILKSIASSSQNSDYSECPNENRKQRKINIARKLLEKRKQTIEDVNKPIILVAHEDGTVNSFSVYTQVKSGDGHLGETLTQRTGACCFSCDATVEDIHNVERIKQGFTMNLTSSDNEQVFEALAKDHGISEEEWSDWTIPSKNGDWNERYGLKGRPISSRLELSRISGVLHTSKLRALTWINNLVTRDAAVKKWGHGARYTENQKNNLECCGDEWAECLGDLTGYRNKSMPNQLTGYLAGRLFEESKRNDVVEKIASLSFWKKCRGQDMTSLEKNNYRELLQRFSVIQRVISSDRCIIIHSFYKYLQDTYIFILEVWSWVLISDSLHRLLGHVWEHIVLNSNMGLACENEQGIECINHKRREDREKRSRKTDLWSNLVDTITHAWAGSDPGVRSFDRQPYCRICQTQSHWTMGCPTKSVGPTDSSGDDDIVQAFFCEKSSEPEEQVDLLKRLFM